MWSRRFLSRLILAVLVSCYADRDGTGFWVALAFVQPVIPRTTNPATQSSLHQQKHDNGPVEKEQSIVKLSNSRMMYENMASRRNFGTSLIAAASTMVPWCPAAWGSTAGDEESVSAARPSTPILAFENRDRKNNQQAVIRDDYWYIMGKTPPRQLLVPLQGADPQWNAFGSCESSADGRTNSCTYVSLNQRIPAYSKYASSIQYGSREYSKLGAILQELLQNNDSNNNDTNEAKLWQQAESFLRVEERTPPPPPVDAELKMILLATALLTSPNFSGPNKELLVARFYVNELHYANTVCYGAVQARDAVTARAAWEFGRDSWNSYLLTVDRPIVPKVGDKLVPVV